ncbi:MAG: acid-inducible putative outer membrane protein YdiY [Sodalis sp. Fle]|nr:MAG: acid-inducible putative outer membrane protein YdiY [Sodalis sp. Fle]
MLCNKRLRALLLLTTLGISLANLNTFADTDIFTALDDPSTTNKNFEGNIQANYNAQSGHTRNSNLTAGTTMTWFQQTNAYSFWGEAANNSSADQRSSEKYQAGTRTRYNLSTENFLFAQASWLSDRYNSYRSRNTFTAGYGRQIFNGPIHILRVECGPSIRHAKYKNGGNTIKTLAYGASYYYYQLTDNTKIIQALSLLANDNTIVNSETGLTVSISGHFALKLAYNIIWNENPLKSIPKHADIKTSISLLYNMQ